jgi:hypothetical protein
VGFLAQHRREEVLGEQRRRVAEAGKGRSRQSSFLSFRSASRAGRDRAESFQSFVGAQVAGEQRSGVEEKEQELLELEAHQVTQQMGRNLVAYMTSFTAQKASWHQLPSQRSASRQSRKGSAAEFFDARSRSSASDQSQASAQRKPSGRGRRPGAASFAVLRGRGEAALLEPVLEAP